MAIASFTDIHWGKKNNSVVHNQDCLDFIDWFCDNVKRDKSIDKIAFLGDWFENRSAINVLTLDMAYQGAKKLNDLGLPIYFMVGNHDLHKRTNRDIHSVNIFNELSNFHIIDKPTVIDNILYSPYIFDHEYKDLVKFINIPVWYGHFEFKDFIVTGYNTIMQHGPDHSTFKNVKRIFSGHFHKRQIKDNIIYIGNTFPMDFGDAGDSNRGMSVYNIDNDELIFKNWENLPLYIKTSLSKVLENDWGPKPKMRVKCSVDIDISYSEAQLIREALIEEYNLREFALEENFEKKNILEETNVDDIDIDELSSIDEIVITLLDTISESAIKIDNSKLVKIYKELHQEK